MIKITRAPARSFAGECRRCRCEFEYELGDLVREPTPYTTFVDDAGRVFGPPEVVRCPNERCGAIVHHLGLVKVYG